MIKLMVREMCSDCPQFSPEVDTVWENDKPIHYVKCMNVDMCREIRRYLMDIKIGKMKEGFDE